MWRKIRAIAWKDTYLTFTDRTLLVMMLLTPLLLSTIIGLAFGGASGGEITFEDIPVAVVNLDEGADSGGQMLNFGATLTDVLRGTDEEGAGDAADCSLDETETPADDARVARQQSLSDLLTVTVLDDPETARTAVDDGTYAAAVIIPATFSAELSPQINSEGASIGQTQVTVYGNEGFALSANIVRSVVTSIIQQFATSNITIVVTYDELIEAAQAGNLVVSAGLLAAQTSPELGPDFACAFNFQANSITIEQIPLDETQQQSQFVQTLLSIGAAQAVFFMLFTGQFGVLDIFYELRQGTLQRLIVSPTPRWAIIVGKLLGVLLSLIVQLVLLLMSLTVIASLVEGALLFIWGNNLLLLFLLVVSIIMTVIGVSTMLVGLARTPEQVQVIGPILNASLAALGGAFGFQLPSTISQFSPVYWAVDGFSKLAGGQNNEVVLNLVVLFSMGSLLVVVGLWLFNRRVEL